MLSHLFTWNHLQRHNTKSLSILDALYVHSSALSICTNILSALPGCWILSSIFYLQYLSVKLLLIHMSLLELPHLSAGLGKPWYSPRGTKASDQREDSLGHLWRDCCPHDPILRKRKWMDGFIYFATICKSLKKRWDYPAQWSQQCFLFQIHHISAFGVIGFPELTLQWSKPWTGNQCALTYTPNWQP